MKRLDYSNTLFIMLFSMLSIFAHAAELREWTSSKGTTLKAELVSKTDSHLTLRQASGKEIALAIKQLSDADQDYLKQLVSTDQADDARPSAPVTKENRRISGKEKKALLPVLHQGDGEGSFAYVEGDYYQAHIYSNGVMHIFLKDEEQTSGLVDGWKMIVEPVAYRKNRLGTVSSLRIVEILKYGEPAENPDRVELSVMLQAGIKCELIYEFNAKGITTWMQSQHGSDPPEMMSHMMTHRLGQVLQLTEDQKDLEKMRLKVGSDKYDYFNKHRINSTVSNDKYEVSMPAITDTKILFDKGSDKNTRLMSWKYANEPLSKGYFIRSRKSDFDSAKHRAEKTSITFKGK